MFEGYKVPKLRGMSAEPLSIANKFTEKGTIHPLLKQTDCRATLETGIWRWNRGGLVGNIRGGSLRLPSCENTNVALCCCSVQFI